MMILVQITSMIAQMIAILLLIWSYLLSITLSITPQLLISSLSKSRSFLFHPCVITLVFTIYLNGYWLNLDLFKQLIQY